MDAVDLWLVDCATAPVARLVTLLDEAEHARLRTLTHAASARRYVATHAAARLILAHRLGTAPVALRWRLTRHGKPEPDGLPADVACSMSHAGRYAAVAVTSGRPVGVDIERARLDAPVVELAQRYFPADEAAAVAARPAAESAALFYRLWTRKEACVKASGARLADGFCLAVGGGYSGRPLRVRADRGPLRGDVWSVVDVATPDGYLGCVAVSGDGPCAVHSHGLTRFVGDQLSEALG
jgi:4'-phosphopantetheinyl transferase